MTYILFSFLSLIFLVGTLLCALYLSRLRYRADRFFTPMKVMFFGTFLSSCFLFLPIYWSFFEQTASLLSRIGKTLLLSVHHAARLFSIDSDFDVVQSAAAAFPQEWMGILYTSLGAVLFIVAPVLTFGFILSFFKNFAAYCKLLRHPEAPLYVFSELSERSLALAKSIVAENGKALIIFSDVYEKDGKESFDLLEESKEIGAISLKSDMLSLNLKFRSAKSEISFFAIAEDESKNISQARSIVNNSLYRYLRNTRFYVFSTSTEGELLISNLQSALFREREAVEEGVEGARKPSILLKRVNDMRSLIYRTLYDEGVQLFRNALPVGEGERLISALVLGTGSQGCEMIRALSWFCQMETQDVKYRVRIHAFDRDKKAKERFAALCPELMSDEYNGVLVDGEAQYRIDIHGDVDVDTTSFADKIKAIGDISYAFISLGSDELNVKVAVTLRTLFERMQLSHKPIIQAVVYDSKNKKALEGAKNAFGDAYDIDFVGDCDTLYSADVIIDSELEDAALEIHQRYGTPVHFFWAHEYNYNSSMASAIHNAVRIKLGVPGADKAQNELSKEERDFIEVLEHRRWNAYMRSEGWVYSGSKEKASRNNLGKMHHNLVSFEGLSDEDKRKDSAVATKRKE